MVGPGSWPRDIIHLRGTAPAAQTRLPRQPACRTRPTIKLRPFNSAVQGAPAPGVRLILGAPRDGPSSGPSRLSSSGTHEVCSPGSASSRRLPRRLGTRRQPRTTLTYSARTSALTPCALLRQQFPSTLSLVHISTRRPARPTPHHQDKRDFQNFLPQVPPIRP
jgi:hypothetical protein